MENQNVHIEMWNIKKHRHRTNSTVEVWSGKIKSFIEEQQLNVFMRVQKRKEEAELVSWQMEAKEPDDPNQKTKKNLGKMRGEN